MQQVNADCADHVTEILDDTICSLRNGPEGGSEFAVFLANDLKSLRNQMFDSLTRTLADDQALRSDVRKFDCERVTKDAELAKLQGKLASMRWEREERRRELEAELSELKETFAEKRRVMVDEQEAQEQSEQARLQSQRDAFSEEWTTLEEKRSAVSGKIATQSQSYADEESELGATIASLESEIQKLSQEHDAASRLVSSELEAEKAICDKQTARRAHLEEEFVRIDANLAVIEEERRVSEAERVRRRTLHDGAVGVQKLWRGARERELAAKMKLSKKKKKGAKKGKKNGKKK